MSPLVEPILLLATEAASSLRSLRLLNKLDDSFGISVLGEHFGWSGGRRLYWMVWSWVLGKA